ncbi:MAG: hypothetical protein Q8N91_00655 [Candidatus Omnitrophota bacterium]|nr:hypothetical protein [Candidatus Omnitrophota bacterium]
MKKIQYEIDPHNRLVIDGSGRKSGLPKFRKVLYGRFKTDENNNLAYHIKAPLQEEESIPHQINLKGEWSLTDDHRLRLTLEKQARETFGDQITLQGEILEVNESSLLFAVTTTTKEGARSTYVLDLGGVWKADEFNRLSFHVKKEKGKYDILTLTGAWEIDKAHRIVYQYEKARLVKKKRQTHTLVFKGYWDIKDALRVSYVLSADTDSVFDFKAASGVFKEGWIKYELGIGLARRTAPERRTVTLFGKWNLKKDVGLVFEIDYEYKNTKAITFGADAKLTGKDTVLFRLKKGIDNKDIGVDLELSHEISKGDGEAFLRLLTSRREAAIYAGAVRRW